jgi:hypothetical protein
MSGALRRRTVRRPGRVGLVALLILLAASTAPSAAAQGAPACPAGTTRGPPSPTVAPISSARSTNS